MVKSYAKNGVGQDRLSNPPPVLPGLESYERFLAEELTRIEGVANIQSSFALT